MNAHCSLEVLSSYVDAELAASEHEEVERHVRECSECRTRLAGLERIVGNLQRLEAVSAPPTLGVHVERRIRFESERQSFSSKMEIGLDRLTRQPLFAPLFALVIAFGAIVYLFSLGVATQTGSETRIVIGGSGAESSESPAEKRSQEEIQPERLERSVAQQSSLADTEGPTLESAEELVLLGRNFVARQSMWQERGVEGRSPEARIDVTAGDLLPEELSELKEVGGTFRLLVDGRLLEIVVPEPGGAD